MSDVKTKPRQRTNYVVSAGSKKFRSDSVQETRNVARAWANSTITFRTEQAVANYLAYCG